MHDIEDYLRVFTMSVGEQVQLKFKSDIWPGKYLVGFDSFYFSFGSGTDHHIKDIKFELAFTCSYSMAYIRLLGEMKDGSNRSIKEGTARVIVLGIPKDWPTDEETRLLIAMQKFEIGYNDSSHHVKGLGVSVKAGKNGNAVSDTAYIEDNSHHIGNGISKGSVLKVPVSIISDMNKRGVCFINGFSMGIGRDDCHISCIGIKMKHENGLPVPVYTLSDKHKNRAEYNQCYVNEKTISDIHSRLRKMSDTAARKRYKINSSFKQKLETETIKSSLLYGNNIIISTSVDNKGVYVFLDRHDCVPFASYDNENYINEGIQRFGDYMITASHTRDDSYSAIRLYKLSNSSIKNLPSLIYKFAIDTAYSLDKNGSLCSAKSVGLTDYYGENGEYRYVIAVQYNSLIDIYDAEAGSTLPDTKFSNMPSFKLYLPVDYSSIYLLTDLNNDVFLVCYKGKRTYDFSRSTNYVDIYKLSLTDKKFSKTSTRMFGPLSSYIYLSTFEYGMGLDNDNSLKLFNTDNKLKGSWFYMCFLDSSANPVRNRSTY